MGKQNRIHLVYTLQIKANATKQTGEEQVDDLVDSIKDTLAAWFPKGEVSADKTDVSDGTKRVLMVNILPAVQRRKSAKKPATDAENSPVGNSRGEEEPRE